MITNTVRRADYIGSGITGPFSFTFYIFDVSDLQVWFKDILGTVSLLTNLEDYSIEGVAVGNDPYGAGGMVTLFSPLADGETLTLLRDPAQTQPRSFTQGGPFFPKNHEQAFDRLTMMVQAMQDGLDRSIKQSVTVAPGADLQLPPASASKLIGWDVTGTQLANWDNDFKESIAQVFVNGVGFTSGVTLALVLSDKPGTAANALVFFDGVEQDHTKWSLTAFTITFNVAIVASKVEVVYRRVIDVSQMVGANQMDARQFGAIPQEEGGSDATTAIQNLWNWSASTGGAAIIRAGTWIVDNLVIKDGMRVFMDVNCVLKHKSGSANHMITMPSGIVQKMVLSGGKLRGNGNAGKHGIYLNAQPILVDGVIQGGCWYSLFDTLDVQGFLGEQVWLRGAGDFTGPHQFLIFNNLISLNATLTTRSLRLTGQVGQVEFIGGQLDGPGRSLGLENIRIERTVDDAGVNNGDLAPYTINFRGTTSQSCNRVATVERAANVLFDGAHFEEAPEGVYGDISCANVKVINSDFQNIGHRDNNDGSGWCVKCHGGGMTAENNTFLSSSDAVSPDTHYINFTAPSDFGLRVQGFHYDSTGIRTSNVFAQMGAATATMDIGGFIGVGIQTSTTPITTINSKHGAPTCMYIQATGGPVYFATGGNLFLSPWRDPLVLKQDAIATFIRSDLGGTTAWRLLSIGQSTGNLNPPGVFTSANGTVDPNGGTEFVTAGGNITRTLPVPFLGPAGTRVTLKKIDGTANTVTVAHAESGTDFILTSGNEWVECEWDGNLWKVVGVGVTGSNPRAAVLATVSTQTTPWGFATQAQADDIVTAVNLIIATIKRLGLFT